MIRLEMSDALIYCAIMGFCFIIKKGLTFWDISIMLAAQSLLCLALAALAAL